MANERVRENENTRRRLGSYHETTWARLVIRPWNLSLVARQCRPVRSTLVFNAESVWSDIGSVLNGLEKCAIVCRIEPNCRP